jgi:hypothetical protein
LRKHKGKSSLRRPSDRWEDNIKMVVKERWDEEHCTHLASYRYQWQDLVITVMNLQCVEKALNF